MTNTSRILRILRSKTSKGVEEMDDPRESLDDSYDQLVRLLQQVRHGLAEVATARKRIELHGQELGARHAKLTRQAEEAMSHGQEGLARTALERRVLLERQVAAIRDQFSALQRQTAGLQEKERHLSDRVAAFKVEKEAIKASYTASQAQAKVNEALGGIGSPMDDIGNSLDHARERVAHMRARAAATEELLRSSEQGNLESAPESDIERRLAALMTDEEVDRQMQSMRQALRPASSASAGPHGEEPDTWLSIGAERDGP